MRQARVAWLAAGAVLLALGFGDKALGDGGKKSFKADLVGYEEPPSVSSTGSGDFKLKLNKERTSFEYELSYEGLEGTVTQSHIHIGQMGVNGGISIWLCGTPALPGPVGTPDCGGPNAGHVTGTVTAASVIGPSGQGVAVGEFDEVLRAMEEGVTYANVHSTRNPGGEIRGQIK